MVGTVAVAVVAAAVVVDLIVGKSLEHIVGYLPSVEMIVFEVIVGVDSTVVVLVVLVLAVAVAVAVVVVIVNVDLKVETSFVIVRNYP